MRSRREFGRFIAAAAIVSSQFSSRDSLGQDSDLQTQLRAFQGNIAAGEKDADGLLRSVIESPVPLASSFESDLVRKHLSERRRFIQNIPRRETELLAQLAAVDEPRRSAARIVLAFQGKLVPSPSDLVAISVPATGVLKCDPIGGVLAILIDVVGLADHKALMIELVKDTRIQGWAQIIADRANKNDWKEVVGAFAELLIYLAATEFFVRLGRPAGQAFARRLGISLVPILGPIYVAIVLVAALKKNYQHVLC